MKRALITGITGQDGSYLAELLLSKGYEVWGLMRSASNFTTTRIEHLYTDPHVPGARLRLVYGDVCDEGSMAHALDASQPDEIYHLAAQSHVALSFVLPTTTSDVTALGTMRLLELVRARKHLKETRIYNAASSELFGNQPPPQNEATLIDPQSPYAAAKAYSYHVARMYRQAYGLFVVNGILFNHDSPRRKPTFVTRKVTRAAARIALGLENKLYLGNLQAQRDWGFAGNYVEGMWRMLQASEPDDFVLATGETHSVQEMVTLAFSEAGLQWEQHVEHDARYDRPLDVWCLQGDASKAERVLGWKPTVRFPELIKMMVQADLETTQRELR